MFTLSVVTPEKIFFEGEVASIVVPGSQGYLGVLTDHAPLITAVQPGKLSAKDRSGKEFILAVSFGFFEISSNHATLLVDSAEKVADIDPDRARQSLERAKKRLAEHRPEIDVSRAQRSLERARNRLHILKEMKG
ncbi:ATP synthase epsilon chain [Candidatus Zixiibacteriota bacterium]|nr:ATP synthase epsilon chain [candidate division Zixibacteria bacterium]